MWTHPVELPDAEDILSNPKAVQYNEEINSILEPHAEILRSLFVDPANVNEHDVPAKEYLIQTRASLDSVIIDAGDLTFAERGRISNWFETHIALDQVNARPLWVSKLPLAHAYTLVLATRMRPQIVQETEYPHESSALEQERHILTRAWAHQSHVSVSLWAETDVDKECIERLEERMFERSKAAGTAGNWQWGMDAGTHQGGWNAYQGTPDQWNYNDRSDHDSELEVTTYLTSSLHYPPWRVVPVTHLSEPRSDPTSAIASQKWLSKRLQKGNGPDLEQCHVEGQMQNLSQRGKERNNYKWF